MMLTLQLLFLFCSMVWQMIFSLSSFSKIKRQMKPFPKGSFLYRWGNCQLMLIKMPSHITTPFSSSSILPFLSFFFFFWHCFPNKVKDSHVGNLHIQQFNRRALCHFHSSLRIKSQEKGLPIIAFFQRETPR